VGQDRSDPRPETNTRGANAVDGVINVSQEGEIDSVRGRDGWRERMSGPPAGSFGGKLGDKQSTTEPYKYFDWAALAIHRNDSSRRLGCLAGISSGLGRGPETNRWGGKTLQGDIYRTDSMRLLTWRAIRSIFQPVSH